MSIQECKEMMADLVAKEEKKLGLGSSEFIQRHNEIMDEANRLLQHKTKIDKRVDVILQEVDHEYTIPSYMEDYVKRGIARALKKIDQDQELLSDLKMEQRETA